MNTDWFGFALVLGVIVVGTPILFLIYKIAAAIWRRVTGTPSEKLAMDKGVSPHALLAMTAVIVIVLIVPVFWMVSFPDRQGGKLLLVFVVVAIAVGMFGEKRLMSNPSYKDSWWCQPIGEKKTHDNEHV